MAPSALLLVAGGQLDINLGRLLRRVLKRGIAFRELLVGPNVRPALEIDFSSQRFVLNGEVISPTAVFIRHDVFLAAATGAPEDDAAALNWHHAVRGWFAARPQVTMFNRLGRAHENNKLENLCLAVDEGLLIPRTRIVSKHERHEGSIRKPVAGGAYTQDAGVPFGEREREYPRFVQNRLLRPEVRVFRIGDELIAFAINSDSLDYRAAKDVRIEVTATPAEIAAPLMRLCTRLGLDFAAADFMRDEDGVLHFLEVNTQPMFAAFDDASDGKLCDLILDALVEGETDDGTSLLGRRADT